MKGIILHGGFGTKLRPLTHTGPKQLIPVANKPISQYVLEDMRNSGITEMAIVLGNAHSEKVKDQYGNGKTFGVKITYVIQNEPRGIAHAVGLCSEYTGDQSFVVYLGDNLLKGGIGELTPKFATSDVDAMILLCQVENPERFGVAELDSTGKLVRLVEKPKEPPSNYALTGIYFFRPVVFEMIKKLKPSWRNELEITEAIQLLLENGYHVGYEFVKDWWKDTGTPEDILEANRLVLDELKRDVEGEIEEEASVQGRVAVGVDSLVKRNALIRGPAILGRKTMVNSNVYIGPYTSIGNNCNIEKGEVENSIIMDNCIINISDKIRDSIIAPHSRITTNKNSPHGRKFILGERTYIEL